MSNIHCKVIKQSLFHLAAILLGGIHGITGLFYIPCVGNPLDSGKQLVTVDQPQLYTHNQCHSVLILPFHFVKLTCSLLDGTAKYSNINV